MTTAQQWAYEVWQKKAEPLHSLLEEYERHKVVFDKQAATSFPPARDEELTINLLLGALHEIDCKVYPLSRVEQDQLRTFLQEEEEKGYIYKGSSPYTAPVFLIGKKDSKEKRVVIDL
jgi:hypothetical protein